MDIGKLLAASVAALALVAHATAFAQAQKGKTNAEKAQDRATFESAFKSADKNNDGGLTRDEMRDAQHSFPVMQKFFAAMDSNKDGKITIAERDAWLAANKGKVAQKMEKDNADRKTQRTEDKAEDRAAFEKAFKAADTNNDGGLTRDEMRKSSRKFPVIEKFFAAMDSNNDAKVTIAERDAWLAANKGKVSKKMQQ
jgi:Ca2+-binding EF-hand superfamily protein